MGSIKYRQRFQGGKWKSYADPTKFNRNAEYYTDIIKNYDEHPALSVYHIGFCRGSADDRYFNHVTKRYKLVYVLDGSGWFNGLPVHAGQGFLMWQDHVNSMSADIKSPWKFIYISFSGSLAEQCILQAGFTRDDTIFDIEDVDYVRNECEKIIYEPCTDRIAEMKMLSILLDLLSLYQNRQPEREAKSSPASSGKSEHVGRAVRFMSKKYRSQIGVPDVAAAAHISEKYLRELFKKETGKSIQRYLTDLRLAAAKNLLSNSKYNIGEIANLSGFGEYRNFVRVFKERYGITPTEYRSDSGIKEKKMKIGIFADPHYSTVGEIKTRRPSLSADKIERLIGIFKSEGVDAIVCLGDLINSEKDDAKDRENLKFVADLLRLSGIPVYCVMGNHDSEAFSPEEFSEVSGLQAPPYAVDLGGAKLIFLDCCYTDDGTDEGVGYRRGNYKWKNSYLPASQIEYLKKESVGAEKVILFTHQNLDDRDNPHCIRNAQAVRAAVESCGIRTAFSGHYHKGGEFAINGVRYITLPALCELDSLPYLIYEF